VEISGADRAELEHWLRAQSIPQALATRARIVLGSAAGESVRGLAARLGVTQTTVCLWRRRYGTHKHPAVKQWLVAHPRCHLHFTPTSASWLNLVERWFGLITAQAIRRSSFDSVARLEQAITRFLANWNENAKPFRWTKSAHQIKRSVLPAILTKFVAKDYPCGAKQLDSLMS